MAVGQYNVPSCFQLVQPNMTEPGLGLLGNILMSTRLDVTAFDPGMIMMHDQSNVVGGCQGTEVYDLVKS